MERCRSASPLGFATAFRLDSPRIPTPAVFQEQVVAVILPQHPAYAALVAKATAAHERHRSPEGIEAADVTRARLYCYAFRLHAIGAFHATRLALDALPPADPLAAAHRQRTVEALADLRDQAMEDVPCDFRVVLSTLHRYHRGTLRVLDGLERELAAVPRESPASRAPLAAIAERFRATMAAITAGCGIHVTQDRDAPEQASFVVPNLGIVIVPLVYGDHHSWNLAHLAGAQRNVPTHRHRQGVEIHLGYAPTHGTTVLGGCRADVDEGYAMPIPPETDHGWVNTSDEVHHVPFVFGSLRHGGWGVFLDVEAQTRPVASLRLVDREAAPFTSMVYLEREIDRAAKMASSWRKTLVPHTVTHRHGSGGLELSLTRVNPAGFEYPRDAFRIVSVARGAARVTIEGIERDVVRHDHFGIPAGMRASLKQTGSEPCVLLDALIRGTPGG